IAVPARGDRALTAELEILVGFYLARDRVPETRARPAPPDRDGDGIPDGDDACPDEPEDRDGVDDGDGCPEMDGDGDGVLDHADRCPDADESWNGFEDDDGCPDDVPAELGALEGPLPGVRFAAGSAEL